MQLEIGEGIPACRPALLRLLNPVFPENTVPGHQRGLDAVIRLALADGDKGRSGAGIVLAREIHTLGNDLKVASNLGKSIC